MILRHWFYLSLLPLFLIGCNELALPGGVPTLEEIPTPTFAPTPTLEPSATPAGPVSLRLWLPPEFNPDSGNPAGDILQSQLNAFVDEHPDIRIEVRVKGLEGPGGMLDSLTAASAAAPLTLPDLVALPRPMLEAAALKGLLHSIDDLSDTMDDQDWYNYARQLGRLQDSTFGLPFAGDAMVLVHRTATVSEPPPTFAMALETQGPLAFPAADPQALFTLALYLSAEGPLLDDQERPLLDAETLTEVLTFYHDGATVELMPFWLTQYETDEQSWGAFSEHLAEMVITWTTRYLDESANDTGVAHIPTSDGVHFTLGDGWVWALVSQSPDRQELSVELAEFLTRSEFLAEWTSAIGYLPPRPSALADWEPVVMRSLVNQVSSSAQLMPPSDIMTSLGPHLQEATIQVLKLESEPHVAAEEAAESLSGP